MELIRKKYHNIFKVIPSQSQVQNTKRSRQSIEPHFFYVEEDDYWRWKPFFNEEGLYSTLENTDERHLAFDGHSNLPSLLEGSMSQVRPPTSPTSTNPTTHKSDDP